MLTATRGGLVNARISKRKDTPLSTTSRMVGLGNARVSKHKVGLGNVRISKHRTSVFASSTARYAVYALK